MTHDTNARGIDSPKGRDAEGGSTAKPQEAGKSMDAIIDAALGGGAAGEKQP